MIEAQIQRLQAQIFKSYDDACAAVESIVGHRCDHIAIAKPPDMSFERDITKPIDMNLSRNEEHYIIVEVTRYKWVKKDG